MNVPIPLPRSLSRLAPAAVLLVAPLAAAQVSVEGEPPSFSATGLGPVPTFYLPPVDGGALRREDELRARGAPFRFGVEVHADLGLDDAGAWDGLPGGDRLWRLRIESQDAVSLSAIFSSFRLPEGAELYVYDDGRSRVLGAYTARNNKENGRFAFEPVPARAITLEYREPAAAEPGEIRIERVVHGYREIDDPPEASCHVGIKCPDGNGWQEQARAVVRIVNGGSVCTGSFLNTTANNGQRMLMTANHCGSVADAVFQFKYHESTCGGGGASQSKSVQGSVLMATGATGDHRLVCVKEDIPLSYGVFFAGWNRSGVAPASTVSIHHPNGLPKSISKDFDPPVRSGDFWNVVAWDVSTTEPGSSGGPLYGDDGRFVGQLLGGGADCMNPFDDYFGAIDSYWTQVAPFLDPLDKGVLQVDGRNAKDSGANPVVGYYDAVATLVGKVGSQKFTEKTNDMFVFFGNKTMTLIGGQGTWKRVKVNGKWRYVVDVKQALKKSLSQGLPSSVTVKVPYFEFRNGVLSNYDKKLKLMPAGKVRITESGKTITILFSGNIVARKDCGCS